MRKMVSVIVGLALLSGCQTHGVGTFWQTHSIDYSDIRAAEEQFAQFAELAAAAPESEALEAMDGIFDLLKEDPVAYYIYTDWMGGAFYNMLSPCRSVPLYSKAVERMVADGVLSESEYEPLLQRREWMQYNRKGDVATVPGASLKGRRTLVLVLDLGCPSCREALEKLAAEPAWAQTARVAVGCGYGSAPDVPGWEYVYPENANSVFDIHMTPVYFVVAADGTVESGYTLAL